MSARVSIFMLKDFPVIGKKGTVHAVSKKYAQEYLLPKKIAKIVPQGTTPEVQQNQISHQFCRSHLVIDKKKESYSFLKKDLRLPRSQFFLKNPQYMPIQSISWEWIDPRRLRFLPRGEIYVKIAYAREEYLGTYDYLKSLSVRCVKNSLVIDGSNIGWSSGFPSIRSVFDAYDYIAKRSEQFFFPLYWVFDRSFRKQLRWGEQKIFDEFCRYSGVRTVDYADREIFETAKKKKTPYIFSNDRFKEFFVDDYIRINL
jgi:hypothetical protein